MQEKVSIISFNTNDLYEEILSFQENKVSEVSNHISSETLYIGEHSPIYTVGSSGNESTDITGKIMDIPIIKSGRGGQVTYHGPGQIVAYPIYDLRNRGRDLRKYICFLQKAIQSTLRDFNIDSHTNDDIGVWVNTPEGEKKIAAIGVRVRKWITFHGLALNVSPNMAHFKGIIPCGIMDRGVTSMEDLGVHVSIKSVQERLIYHLTLSSEN